MKLQLQHFTVKLNPFLLELIRNKHFMMCIIQSFIITNCVSEYIVSHFPIAIYQNNDLVVIINLRLPCLLETVCSSLTHQV